MPSLKHNCSDELYAHVQQGPSRIFAENPLTNVLSMTQAMYLHYWVLSSEFALRHAAKVQSANKTIQCGQVLAELLLSSCDLCNSEKEALEWRLLVFSSYWEVSLFT